MKILSKLHIYLNIYLHKKNQLQTKSHQNYLMKLNNLNTNLLGVLGRSLGITLDLVGSGLGLLSIVLLSQSLGLGEVTLGLVDGFDQDTLVLVLVTLTGHVEVMVGLLVDLVGLTVLAKETTQDTLATHPEELGGHTSFLGTLSLTETTMATLALGGLLSAAAGARVDRDGLTDDETVLEELAHGKTRIGHANLVDLKGINPDAVLTASFDGGCETLLELKARHCCY